jgi:hypothetical protein
LEQDTKAPEKRTAEATMFMIFFFIYDNYTMKIKNQGLFQILLFLA